MIHECYKTHYDSQVRKIHKHFSCAAHFNDVEAVHELRVEIKRLLAFVNLVALFVPEFKLKSDFKQIKRLFKKAGILRNIHIYQEIARHWTHELHLNINEYHNFLKEHEMKARKEFLETAKDFDFSHFDKLRNRIFKSIKYVNEDMLKHKTRQYFVSLIQIMIQVRNRAKMAEKDFHELRIMSKESMYIIELIQKCMTTQSVLEELRKTLKALHQVLGKWHDDVIAMEFFQIFMERHSGYSFYNKNSYIEYYIALEGEIKSLLSEFGEKWEPFFTLATPLEKSFPPNAAPELPSADPDF
jgi:CHAD domain-containing protein